MFTDPQLQVVNGLGWLSLNLEQDIRKRWKKWTEELTTKTPFPCWRGRILSFIWPLVSCRGNGGMCTSSSTTAR